VPGQGAMILGKASVFLAGLFFGTFVSFLPARAEVAVRLEVERTQARIGETVGLVVRLEGSRDAQTPRISGLEGFRVDSGGTSSRVEMINGKVNASLDHRYYITPTIEGRFTVGPAQITLDGTPHRSNTVSVTVTPAPAEHEAEKGPLYVTAELNAERAYPGQELVYTLTFYRAVWAADITLALPEAQGVSLKRLGDPSEYGAVRHGTRYQAVAVTYSLVAERPGTYTLPSAVLKMKVRDNERSRSPSGRRFFHDDFFGLAPTKPATIASNPVALTVLPFPEEGRPADFAGLVGHFTLDATVEPEKVKAGESATLTVVMKGSGNVQLMPDVKLPPLEGLKTYADQPVLQVEPGPNGQAGVKTMKWALVGQQPGPIPIPSLQVSFMDPEENAYKTVRTPALTLRVEPGEQQAVARGAGTGPASAPKKSEVALLGHDILPIRTEAFALNGPGPILGMGFWPRFWVVLFPMFLFVGSLLIRRVAQRDHVQAAEARAKKALSRFRKQSAHPTQEGAPALHRALQVYLNDRMVLPGGSLTPAEAQHSLAARGVAVEDAAAVRRMLERLEALVFAGRDVEPLEGLRKELFAVLKRVDGQVRREPSIPG